MIRVDQSRVCLYLLCIQIYLVRYSYAHLGAPKIDLCINSSACARCTLHAVCCKRPRRPHYCPPPASDHTLTHTTNTYSHIYPCRTEHITRFLPTYSRLTNRALSTYQTTSRHGASAETQTPARLHRAALCKPRNSPTQHTTTHHSPHRRPTVRRHALPVFDLSCITQSHLTAAPC